MNVLPPSLGAPPVVPDELPVGELKSVSFGLVACQFAKNVLAMYGTSPFDGGGFTATMLMPEVVVVVAAGKDASVVFAREESVVSSVLAPAPALPVGVGERYP